MKSTGILSVVAKVLIKNYISNENCQFQYFSNENSEEHDIFIDGEEFECWINTRETDKPLKCITCYQDGDEMVYRMEEYDDSITIDMLRTSILFHEAYWSDEDVNHAYDDRHGDMPKYAQQEYLNFISGIQLMPPVTPCGMSNFATDWLDSPYIKEF